MKYRVLPRFSSDYQRLSPEERDAFTAALARFIAAAKEYEDKPQGFVWPGSLRIERLTGTRVMAMTWSLRGPDGRATFQLENLEGQLWVTWRRVGRHEIYREP